MTIPFWCLLIITILPYILTVVSTYFRITGLKSFDNNHPRDELARLEGPGARSVAAQQNAWEAAIVFAISVFVAHLAGADAQSSANLAIAFVICRILHPILYIANLATLRSLIFVASMVCCFGLFYLATSASV